MDDLLDVFELWQKPWHAQSVVRNKGSYSTTTVEDDILPTLAWDMLGLKLCARSFSKLFILMDKEIGMIQENYWKKPYPLTIATFEFEKDLFGNKFS